MSKSGVKLFSIQVIRDQQIEAKDDLLVVEEPLEIRLRYGNKMNRNEMNLAITMRTPGNDFELVRGFLFSEGIISKADDVLNLKYCINTKQEEENNIIKVELAEWVGLDEKLFKRNFYMSSSCGVCGKSSIESVMENCKLKLNQSKQFKASVLLQLPELLREAQLSFKYTGGLHASALFNEEGKIIAVREDVGRHNALDKIIGALMNQNLQDYGLILSGRVSFELMQKAAMAGIQVVCAIGAPSSLAVEMANEFNITLIGFLKSDKMNIYSGEQRILY
ncbi:MAG: formate dehydrogenase accessory sulfurtransferase FdhD [Bacteroidia bacterium]